MCGEVRIQPDRVQYERGNRNVRNQKTKWLSQVPELEGEGSAFRHVGVHL